MHSWEAVSSNNTDTKFVSKEILEISKIGKRWKKERKEKNSCYCHEGILCCADEISKVIRSLNQLFVFWKESKFSKRNSFSFLLQYFAFHFTRFSASTKRSTTFPPFNNNNIITLSLLNQLLFSTTPFTFGRDMWICFTKWFNLVSNQ